MPIPSNIVQISVTMAYLQWVTGQSANFTNTALQLTNCYINNRCRLWWVTNHIIFLKPVGIGHAHLLVYMVTAKCRVILPPCFEGIRPCDILPMKEDTGKQRRKWKVIMMEGKSELNIHGIYRRNSWLWESWHCWHSKTLDMQLEELNKCQLIHIDEQSGCDKKGDIPGKLKKR